MLKAQIALETSTGPIDVVGAVARRSGGDTSHQLM